MRQGGRPKIYTMFSSHKVQENALWHAKSIYKRFSHDFHPFAKCLPWRVVIPHNLDLLALSPDYLNMIIIHNHIAYKENWRRSLLRAVQMPCGILLLRTASALPPPRWLLDNEIMSNIRSIYLKGRNTVPRVSKV